MRARQVGRSEGGFTLVEVLITLAIMSIAFVGILTAIGSMIYAGAEHQKIAGSEVVARSLAETVKSLPCVTTTYPLSAPGYTVTNTVTEWNGDNPATYTGAASCSPGAQLVTINVTAQGFGPSITQSVSVVKRS